MISHRTIMINCATAIAGDAGITRDVVSEFGRGLDINVGAYASGLPTAADSPFLHIFAAANDNEMIKADQIFTMHGVLGGCVKGEGGENVIVTRTYARTATANGLTVNGGNAVIESLRDDILEVIRGCNPGAIVTAIRRTENDLSHFPLEWAEFEVDFMEPDAL